MQHKFSLGPIGILTVALLPAPALAQDSPAPLPTPVPEIAPLPEPAPQPVAPELQAPIPPAAVAPPVVEPIVVPPPTLPPQPAPSAALQPAAAPPPAPSPAQQAPSPAPATAPVFTTTGHFFTRYEVREGYKDLGVSAGRFLEGQATAYRARLGVRTAPISTGGPDVVLQFTPQASGWLAELNNTVADSNLTLHEGYLRLTDAGHYAFDIGRFSMDYGDALVIGNLDWHQTGRSFEGMRARFDLPRGAWLDTFFTQIREGRPLSDPVSAGDQFFYGAYTDVGPLMGPGLAFDVYGLGQTSAASNGVRDQMATHAEPATEITVGLRVKHKVEWFNYRLETGAQFGNRQRPDGDANAQTVPVSAFQIDGEIGATAPGERARVHIGGLYASGDDPTTPNKIEGWNQLYPTAHKFIGLSDVFGARSNAVSLNGGLWVKAAPKLIFATQVHSLWRPERAANAMTQKKPDSYAGTELDAHVVSPLGKGLTLRTMYALVLANKHGVFNNDGPAHYWETELGYAF
jgi:hypothetical protein